MAGLQQAHRGYLYQDITTAYFLTASLLRATTSITVDRKGHADDRFDDLTIEFPDGRIARRQIKRSDEGSRALEVEDLRTEQRDLRIDQLVLSWIRDGKPSNADYRICSTWKPPTTGEIVAQIETTIAEPSFGRNTSVCYQLRADVIWPDAGQPVWRCLRDSTQVQRDDFVQFAKRFVIELDCPQASLDLHAPGPLEDLLVQILEVQIGIGRYPNQNRDPRDAAATLIYAAAEARSAGRTLNPGDVERLLRLQTDFGRVSQQFPLKRSVFVEPRDLQTALTAKIENGGLSVVVGPPGSGKSWELTALADKLASEGCIVARHYCFLEPGDPDVQRRITINVLFGNLIADLIDAAPSLRGANVPRYSAGFEELERLLQEASNQFPDQRVVLIVDGLDHIARVLRDAPAVAPEETDIVGEIAALRIPPTVSLLIGSQPGGHLRPLLDAGVEPIEVPSWESGLIKDLLDRLNVIRLLNEHGLTEVQVDHFVSEVLRRSEGNALYATFLAREILRRFADGEAFDPVPTLQSLPPSGGELSTYYEYLLNAVDELGSMLADFLGVVDFGLTAAELQQIFPSWARHIENSLRRLSPVLDGLTTQGGVRIYHESFRRYICERIRSTAGSLQDVLAPVIAWLEQRGFFADAKAFRFLLPCFVRAGQHQKVVDRVGPTFISDSVAAGHPREAIEANLAVMANVAAQELNWPALVRYVELSRSLYTCFEENSASDKDFGSAFCEVFGANALAERLSFDGKATQSRDIGLVLCSVCDDAGGSPPWSVYLNLSAEGRKQDSSQAAVAAFHGALREGGSVRLRERLLNWLKKNQNPEIRHLRDILRRWCQFNGAEDLLALLREAGSRDEVAAVFELEYAAAVAAIDAAKAGEAAARALQQTAISTHAIEAIRFGADAAGAERLCSDCTDIDLGLGERHSVDAGEMARWRNTIRISAHTNRQRLETELNRVRGVGWYRGWLQFVIKTADAEQRASADRRACEADVVRAFQELCTDTNPFRGKPRACDLFGIRSQIHDSFQVAIDLIESTEAWEAVLAALVKITRETTTYLQRSPGGPLVPEALLDLILPFASRNDLKSLIRQSLEPVVENLHSGELYGVVARDEMLFARLLAATGDVENAQKHWRTAAIHLCAYGMRKDVTIEEILDPIDAFTSREPNDGRTMLASVQPLTTAVVQHTDGKGTEYVVGKWFELLAAADFVGAAWVLGQSMIPDGGSYDYRIENGIEALLEKAPSSVDPFIALRLAATKPWDNDDSLDVRLPFLHRGFQADPERAKFEVRSFAAQVQGDPEKFAPQLYEKISEFAADRSTQILPGDAGVGRVEEEEEKQPSVSPPPEGVAWKLPTVLPPCDSPQQMLIELRQIFSERDNGAPLEQMVNWCGYRLVSWSHTGRGAEVDRLLMYISHADRFGRYAGLLSGLAEGLQRYQCAHLAARAYALAYARARGGGGWLTLGGSEYESWLIAAVTLSREVALHTLANELVHLIAEWRSVFGASRHIIEFFIRSGDPTLAKQIWNEAFVIIQHRLPDAEKGAGPFTRYAPAAVPNWSPDEAIVYGICARLCHPELARKESALASVSTLLERSPTLFLRPTKELVRTDLSFTSTLLLWLALVEFEPTGYAITRHLEGELFCLIRSHSFGLRVLSTLLLERAGVAFAVRAVSNWEPIGFQVPSNLREAVECLDWGERFELIEPYWPDFRNQVVAEFTRIFHNNPNHQQRMKHRYEASTSVHETFPKLPMLHWEREMFETVFHNVLDGLEEKLWATGNWSPEIIVAIVKSVCPDVRLHSCFTLSRSVRPSLELPANLPHERIREANVETAGEFAGWYRGAYYERQLLTTDGAFPKIDGEAETFACVFLTEEEPELDEGILPLVPLPPHLWTNRLRPGEEERFARLNGSVGGLIGIGGVLQFKWLLGLNPVLIAHCGLTPRRSAGSLELVDAQGATAVVIQSWRVRPLDEDFAGRTPHLKGCQLLIRPDVFGRMVARFGGQAREVLRVTRSVRAEDE